PKVVGSNPAPATKHQKRLLERVAFFVRVCFALTGSPIRNAKEDFFGFPKLNAYLRPFAAIAQLFQPLQD
ncbi:hypothetical protein, partial [Pseudomonas sp. SWRI81]|uniref:hypothetical protein n=1 Tax=Pseudomonas sp. SWRI81 TaxID=2745505 RepID=UPI001EE22C62